MLFRVFYFRTGHSKNQHILIKGKRQYKKVPCACTFPPVGGVGAITPPVCQLFLVSWEERGRIQRCEAERYILNPLLFSFSPPIQLLVHPSNQPAIHALMYHSPNIKVSDQTFIHFYIQPAIHECIHPPSIQPYSSLCGSINHPTNLSPVY